MIKTAEKNGGKLDWINCGLCVDERGVSEAIDGIRRGALLELRPDLALVEAFSGFLAPVQP